MTVRNGIKPQWLHVLLAVVGFLVLLVTVVVAVVAFTTLIYAVTGVLFGASTGEVTDSLSITQIASDQADDLYAWASGVLFFIILLPYFMSYNDWLGRVLYDRDYDTDSEP